MYRLQKAPGSALLLLFLLLGGVLYPAQRADVNQPSERGIDAPNLTIEVDVSGVTRLDVEVRGPDLKKPLQFNLVPRESEFAQGIAVPPGALRDFRVTAFGKKGERLYSGRATASIDAKFTPPFALALVGPSSKRAGSVVLGTYRMRLDSERLGEEGNGAIRVRAKLINGRGETVPLKPGDISWGGVALPDGGFVPCTQDPVGCIELNPQNPGLNSPDAVVACLRDIWCKGMAKRPPEGPWVRVAVGANHTCALAKSGKIFCWGNDERGQLGIQADLNCQLSTFLFVACALGPTEVTCSANETCRFTTVVAAGDHTCAIDNRSNVWCWGDDPSGVTGDEDSAVSDHREILEHGAPGTPDVPIVANALDTNVTHSCAIRRPAGTVVCWGGNAAALGRPPGATTGGFAQSAASPSAYRAIAVGTHHTCAIRQVGQLDCWGANVDSQLAPRDNPAYTNLLSSFLPVQMSTIHPLLNRSNIGFDAIAADQLMSCTKQSNGEVVCWGGIEGLNPDNPQLLPPVVRDAPDGIVFSNGIVSDPGLAVSTRLCGNLRCTNICAVANLGTLACGNWGVAGRPTLVPVPGQPSDVRFVQVDTGPKHTCAVSSRGFIFCIGANEFGQLGDGTTTSRNTLVRSLGLPEPLATIKFPPRDDLPRPWPPR